MTDPLEAIRLLELCQITLDPIEAIAYLENWTISVQMLHLYQKFFPQQWVESDAPIQISWQSTVAFAAREREREFIVLVNSSLFPLCPGEVQDYLVGEDELLEIFFEEEMQLGIPVTTRGPDMYCNELSDGWQALFPLINNDYNNDCTDGDGEPNKLTPPNKINWNLLRAVARFLSKPFCFFPEVIDLLNYASENAWLLGSADVGPEYYPWDEQSLNFLAEQWQEAMMILDYTDDFIEWLEVDLEKRFQIIASLWNACSAGQFKPAYKIAREIQAAIDSTPQPLKKVMEELQC